MAATNHTEHYNLPQYVSTDVPTYLVDANTAYLAIDNAIYSADSNAALAEATASSAEATANSAQETATSAQTDATSALAIANGHTAQIANVSKAAGVWITGQSIAIGTQTATVVDSSIHTTSIIEVFFEQGAVISSATYTVTEGQVVVDAGSAVGAAVNFVVNVVNP